MVVQSNVAEQFSLHPQRLEDCIPRIGVKARLELGEELAGDRGDVADAGHWQEQALGTGIRRDL